MVQTIEKKCCECGMPLADGESFRMFYPDPPYQGHPVTVNFEPGQKLIDGRYTIESVIGKGFVSTIYLAADSKRSEQVALKILPIVSYEKTDHLKKRIESLSGINDYTNIIRIHNVHRIEYEGIVLLIVSTEYADGITLEQWMLNNRDNVCKRQSEGQFYVKQACRAAAASHDAGLIHGDLRPEKFIFKDGNLKLLTLSLSQLLHSNDTEGSVNNHSGLDFSFGSAAYMAPERFMAAREGDIDRRIDIYSLGVMLYQTCHLQGRLPFEGTYRQLRQRHLQIPAPVLEGVSARIAHVTARCLQKGPADRYKNVSELIDDLEGGNAQTGRTDQAGSQKLTEPVQQWWDQASGFFEDGKLNEADRLCDRILQIFPDFEPARDIKDDIDRKFQQAKQFYNAIGNGIDREPLEKLTDLLCQAIEIYPDHPDSLLIQEQLSTQTERYNKFINDGLDACQEDRWQEAMSNLKRAAEMNCDAEWLTKLINLIENDVVGRQEQTRARIDEAIRQQHWDKAMSLARSIDQYIDNVKRMATSLRNQE
jgi:serine/threonine protein kinase